MSAFANTPTPSAHQNRDVETDGKVQKAVPSLIVRSNSQSEEDGTSTDAKRLPPTLEASAELQFAYEYFNEKLFEGTLPQCVITYTRQKRVLGYFCPDRFERAGGELWSEIALNPTYLAVREDKQSLSTLAHEQCHLWRHYLGPPNRQGRRGARGYHDVIWARKMEEIGLVPSTTGAPGGKKTGQRVTHYLLPDGPFDRACSELLANGFSLRWRDNLIGSSEGSDQPKGTDSNADPNQRPKKTRLKFTCKGCGLNAWAKPSALLVCGDCHTVMRAAGQNPSTSLTKL